MPNTSISSPANNAVVSGITTILATASDNVGVTKVELYADTSLIETDTASPYSALWNTFGLASLSSHTLYTKAYDAAGNIGTSPQVQVKIADIIAPTISITSPLDGVIVPSRTIANFITRRSTLNITASASDDIAVARVQFYVNNSLKCTDNSYPDSCIWSVPSGKNKVYGLQAKAYDTANNIGASSIVKITAK